MDTIIFRKWLEDNEILDKSNKLFWQNFRENLCMDWTRGLKLSSPLKEEYISLELYQVCLKIEDIDTTRKTNQGEYVEVCYKVSFKGGAIADFDVRFDFEGKWLSHRTDWNSLFRALHENIIALEGLKEMFEKEVTEEEYGLETRQALINIIDRKIRDIKDAFE